ncbi:probable LRR receptor-like serine/threonine-protein kinase At3g47570 [Salvia hispanica]|uniref:probable LRR receptor-like serine/threonine-protein kinase At3g47570 n=1 Tax=Salvia hispanica TaxID=49212 RepID=UPI002009DA6C|nr:probable LRR receptor-like serine/threonine-protein kinase At3g47570 [Salvia hispanica]
MEKMLYYYILAYAFLTITFQTPCSAKMNLATDQTALLSLKQHIISDPSHILATNWTNSSSVCSWIGVSCSSRHHRVSTLNLSYMNLSGTIPPQLGHLSFLVSLDLTNNNFSGSIPKSLSNLTNLRFLYLNSNSLSGEIPKEFGKHRNLQRLWIAYNHLSGVMPSEIFNMSKLVYIELAHNELSGSLPADICSDLPFLVVISLSENQLSGAIPTNLSLCSQLKTLSLSKNSFNGQIPAEIGYLTSLRILYLGDNSLNGTLPPEIGNLHSLVSFSVPMNKIGGTLSSNIVVNMSSLQGLTLWCNNFTGNISRYFGNLTMLTSFSISENYMTGIIPTEFGQLRRLKRLALGLNSFSGTIPHDLFNISTLQYLELVQNVISGFLPANLCHTSPIIKKLHLGANSISGPIPNSISNCSQLRILSLGDNKLSGYIPTDLGNLRLLEELSLYENNLKNAPSSSNLGFLTSLSNCRSLTELVISDNPLYGVIPASVGNLSSSLEKFDSSRCKLNGSIPVQIGGLKGLTLLELEGNELTGNIPLSIKYMHKLQGLYLDANKLQGSIPESNMLHLSIPSSIWGLKDLLADDKLEGSIPVSMGNMISLVRLDLSHNNLSSSIQKSLEELQLLNYFNVSFNSLSGEIPSGGSFRNFTMDSFKENEALCGIQRFHVPICPVVSDHRTKRKKVEQASFIAFGYPLCQKGSLITNFCKRLCISVRAICLALGVPCSVYKGILNNGKLVAAKVFNLQLEGISKIFDVECEILCSIRHRCLNSVISCCSNEEFKALILEYMPNGNLEKWLYSHNYFLNFMERLNIMIDVASALEYLHGGYSTPIFHSDLKPSNVLLDEDMVTLVSDFGIAKFLCDGDSTVLTNTLGTLGYIAPEYGSEGLVSTRCDVYSYGVMLMEVFTRKKPSDDMFVGDLSLKS